uniref:Transcriptional regulator n=1 Tax=uncultured marine thaumarchaeote KM3_05_F10 TaxID=1455969 RepID=A0A075G4G1_9ARCH|nr:transcriptional regulator [uncultured marine thaumarchaeote KM3_05_F10]
MAKKEIDPETANQIKKELAELRAQLETQKKTKKKLTKSKVTKPKKEAKSKVTKPKKEAKSKVTKPKKEAKSKVTKPKKEAKSKVTKPKKEAKPKVTKPKKEAKPKVVKPKKPTKAELAKAKKEAKLAKEKAEAEAKAKEEAAKRTPEDDIEDQFSDEQIRNFQIEKMDMDKLTNKVCEIIADYEDKGMLQSDLWKKLKLNSRDGSRLALRLERRGLITREKMLQKGRWTYKLIIEQAPIKLESLVDSPCLTCPVEQKCDFENAYPEPSPLHCQLIEDWVTVEFSKKKK